MKIGVIKEIKDQENRVGLTPENVSELVKLHSQVFVQSTSGIGAGFSDREYIEAGATMLETPLEVVNQIDILVKIKEPIDSEYPLLEAMKGKILFTFLHLSANRPLADELMLSNITGISYDTIEDQNGNLPMLKPMSEIAGQMAIELAVKHNKFDKVGKVFVIGGGVAGLAAVQKALDSGATNVCVYEPNPIKVAQIKELFYDEPVDVASCIRHVVRELNRSNIIIGAALVKGEKAPLVISKEMLKELKPNTMIVDVSIDQGGCIYGSRPTTHTNPTYEYEGKVFCCIPNLPGNRPRIASEALTKLSMPYLMGLCELGLDGALKASPALSKGLNTRDGKVVNKIVAEQLGLQDDN